MLKGEFLYDYKYDLLTFKIKDREYKQSFELQNFVVDVDEKNYITGIRIQDASQVTGVDKYALKSLVSGSFKASYEDGVVNIRIKFVSKVRNKMFLSEKKNFIQQFTSPVNTKEKLHGTEAEV